MAGRGELKLEDGLSDRLLREARRKLLVEELLLGLGLPRVGRRAVPEPRDVPAQHTRGSSTRWRLQKQIATCETHGGGESRQSCEALRARNGNALLHVLDVLLLGRVALHLLDARVAARIDERVVVAAVVVESPEVVVQVHYVGAHVVQKVLRVAHHEQ